MTDRFQGKRGAIADKEALNEFLRGVVFAIGIIGVFILFIAIIGTPESPQNEAKFGVVDQYKDCDVVRYTDPSNRYRYFLDCSK